MNKYLKKLPFFWLNCMIGAFLIALLTAGISAPLIGLGVITVKNPPGLSFLWVNWELNLIFISIFAGVTWLVYQLNFREKRR